MSIEKRQQELKSRAEQIVNFSPKEISSITPEEIQRLFYDLQVYQIELQMQNDELQKTQLELTQANNKHSFIYHSLPIGIVILDHQGFIEQINHAFTNMLKLTVRDLVKKHFSKLILETDKNIFIQRYEAFFKSPQGKSMHLHLLTANNKNIPVLIQGNAFDESDDLGDKSNLQQRKLIFTITDLSSVESN